MTDAHFSPEALALMEQVKAWRERTRVSHFVSPHLDPLIALMPEPAYEPTDAEVAGFLRWDGCAVDIHNRAWAIGEIRRLRAAGFRWAPDE